MHHLTARQWTLWLVYPDTPAKPSDTQLPPPQEHDDLKTDKYIQPCKTQTTRILTALRPEPATTSTCPSSRRTPQKTNHRAAAEDNTSPHQLPARAPAKWILQCQDSHSQPSTGMRRGRTSFRSHILNNGTQGSRQLGSKPGFIQLSANRTRSP